MRRAGARNRSIWPSVACRIHEPWNDTAKGSIRPKPMKQNHGPSIGHSGGAIRRLNQVGCLVAMQEISKAEFTPVTTGIRAQNHGCVETEHQRPLIRVSELKSFRGTRSAKELENFLWDMEQYFIAAKVPKIEKEIIASMYLIGDAKLWWQTRMVDDANAGRQKINTWDQLKKEMKDQFLPGNTSWIAHDGLKRLKQSSSMRDYVKEFSSLMLDIQNMSEEDKLYNFLYGLQPWAQIELRSKENLNTSSSSKSNFIRKDKKGYWKKEVKKDAKKKDSGNNHGKGKAEHSAARGKDNLKNQCCFLCNDPHFVKDCPKRKKLNALLLGDKGEDYEQETWCGLILYSCTFFVMMNEKSANAMVDTGVTHTFVSAKLVQDYGLSISKRPRYIKSVNANAQAVVDMIYNVLLTVGTWVGKANMMVIPLEDFQIIPGMDFLQKMKTVLMPHLDGVMVMQESNPCFIPIVHPYGKGQKRGRPTSYMQYHWRKA
ncbi:hypothetical protein ZIOFF_070449 [Zingiber officinale]|uniref:Retrotransposon gag domain-containing protein n=1 Tax=Zingiber officinale TaxID=94328 RepID=A0A8J5EVC4_ZINOF|nr:hypothetical protein ZIOFF_070449 [Zingiber officinale]